MSFFLDFLLYMPTILQDLAPFSTDTPQNPLLIINDEFLVAGLYNAFKGCLNKIRETRMGFFMDQFAKP